MAKPLSKKIKKNIKKTSKSIQRSLDNLGPDDGPSKAAVAGMAVAGAAGVAAFIHFMRKGPRNAATFHVAAKDDQWVIKAEGSDEPVSSFQTKKEALKAARKAATEAAPSDLVIHGSDGSVQKSHSYEAN